MENFKKKKKKIYIYSKKKKKKVFLIFQEIELSSPKLKNFLIFSQKKLFLYFVKWNFLAPSLKTYLSGSNFEVATSLPKFLLLFLFFLNKLIILFLFLKILRDIRNTFRLEKENKGIKDKILGNI